MYKGITQLISNPVIFYQIRKPNEDYESSEYRRSSSEQIISEVSSVSDAVSSDLPNEDDLSSETTEASKPENRVEYKRSLSGGLQSPKTDVPRTAILQRINSKKAVKSYQLGHQLSNKWSTGAGPRIGCMTDYPVELRLQALELTNLSPRTGPPSLTPRRFAGAIVSPSDYQSKEGGGELEALLKV